MAHFLLICNDAGSIGAQEDAVKDILEIDGGHTVTLISDSDAVPADMSPYDCVVAGPQLLATDMGTKYTALSTPLAYIGANGNVGVNLDFIDTNTDFGTTGITQVDITDDTHDIAGDLTGTVTIYGASESIAQCAPANLGAGLQEVAVRAGAANVVVCGWEAGSALGDGTAAGRRGWSGLRGDYAEYTEDGRTLNLQLMEWTAGIYDVVDHELDTPVTAVRDLGQGLGIDFEFEAVQVVRGIQSIGAASSINHTLGVVNVPRALSSFDIDMGLGVVSVAREIPTGAIRTTTDLGGDAYRRRRRSMAAIIAAGRSW